ncbi:MAG: patatin [Sneathiella sp.]|nr:MAG: patatin [Sneathiella sp.]
MFKILSIDGGGIRGVIPAVLLEHMEQQAGKPISEMFDLIVGTSTGGILAAGLAVPGKNGKPKYQATDLLALYADHGSKIFGRSFWDGITSLGGIVDEQYDAAPLEKLLQEYMGKSTLKDCLTPIVLTSYDIELRQPYFFKTSKAKVSDRNHYLWHASRATSAAPTFFEPFLTPSRAQKSSRRVLVDGGVFMNNPSMCAFSEAAKAGAAMEDIIMVSLGTGANDRKIKYEDAVDWGILKWAKPIIDVMMDGQADAAHYHLSQMFPAKDAKAAQRYFRFDTRLDLALDDMDAANAGNILALKAEAQQILTTDKAEFKRMIGLIK